MRTNIKGDIGELSIMREFLKLNYWCSKPFGDDCPYDLIVDNKNGELKRVQIKYVTPNESNTLRVKLFSETGISYRETVDWIAVYNSESEKCYLLKLDTFDSDVATLYLRLDKPKNNQSKGINLAENYELK
jgi:hypothetical protein